MRWPAIALVLGLLWSLPIRAADTESILVPESVAVLVRPMLDLRQKSIEECHETGNQSKCADGEAYTHEMERLRKFADALHKLTEQHGSTADETLVVLMCFYVGESQEEADSVIRRGRRMLPYLKKYQDRVPVIPNRKYPNAMLHNPDDKIEYFKGVTKAIHKGWKSTSDNPDG